MIKWLLKNDGGYKGMDGVEFPATVEISHEGRFCVVVKSSELERIGCDMSEFEGDDDEWWFLKEDCKEVVEQ